MKHTRRVLKKKLGQILIENGIITRQELDEALKVHKSDGKLIGEVLVGLGYATEEEITATVSAQYGIPYISLEQYEIENSIIALVAEPLARQHRCIPLDKMGDVLTLVIDNPVNEATMKELEEKTGLKVRCFTSTWENISNAINRYYSRPAPEKADLEAVKGLEEKTISTFEIAENGATVSEHVGAKPAGSSADEKITTFELEADGTIKEEHGEEHGEEQ